MTIEELQETLTDLQKQYKESSELTLKIAGAIELTAKMIQQENDKEEKDKLDKAETADDLVDNDKVFKGDSKKKNK